MLSALALLLVPVFWIGILPVLAVGGMLLGRAARTRPAGVVAVVLGRLALLAVASTYVLDALSTHGLL